MKFCFNCGAELDNANQNFCMNCGADLKKRKIKSNEFDEKISKGIKCESCGHDCKLNDLFCLNCGFLLKDYKNKYNLDEVTDVNSLIKEIEKKFEVDSENRSKSLRRFGNEITLKSYELERITSQYTDGKMIIEEFRLRYVALCKDLSKTIERRLEENAVIDFNILNNLDSLSSICTKAYSKNEIDKELNSIIESLKGLVESNQENVGIFRELDSTLYPNGNHVNKYIISTERLIVYEKAYIRELENIKAKNS